MNDLQKITITFSTILCLFLTYPTPLLGTINGNLNKAHCSNFKTLNTAYNANGNLLYSENFSVSIQVRYKDSDADKKLKVEILKFYDYEVYPLNKLMIIDINRRPSSDWSFTSYGSIHKNLEMPKGYYGIVINDLLIYNIYIEKNDTVIIETDPSISKPELFGSWKVKKWHGTYSVSLADAAEGENKYSVGYLDWYNGCNACGSLQFIIVNEKEIKILNPDGYDILCTLLACNNMNRFDIPRAEWIRYKKKKNKIILKFKIKRSNKRMVLRKIKD